MIFSKEEGKEEEEEDDKEEVYLPQYRERKRKFKHDLLVSESDNPIVQMTNAEILASKGKLEKLHAKDQAKRETEAAKSNLEAYIYSSRSKVRQDEDIEKVTTEEQRESHLQSLEDAEDWLYTDEGENANKTTYETKHKGLKDVSDAFIFRAQESSVRPESVKYAKKWIADTRKTIGTWKDKKKHIFANETEPLLQDIADLESFLEEKEKEQEAKEAQAAAVASSRKSKPKAAGPLPTTRWTVFLNQLPYTVTQRDIAGHMAAAAGVEPEALTPFVRMCQRDGQFTGSAFVDVPDEAAAVVALELEVLLEQETILLVVFCLRVTMMLKSCLLYTSPSPRDRG